MSDLAVRLRALGLLVTAASLDDSIATATKKRWGAQQLLEYVADTEEKDRARRGLERRMSRSRLERFKPMADFDWDWPTKSIVASSSLPSASTSSSRAATSCSSRPRGSARR